MLLLLRMFTQSLNKQKWVKMKFLTWNLFKQSLVALVFWQGATPELLRLVDTVLLVLPS